MMTDVSHDLTFLDIEGALPICRLCGEEVTTAMWLVDAPCPVKVADAEPSHA